MAYYQSRMEQPSLPSEREWWGLRELPGGQVAGRRLVSEVLLHNDARLLLEGGRRGDYGMRLQRNQDRDVEVGQRLNSGTMSPSPPNSRTMPEISKQARAPEKQSPQPSQAPAPVQQGKDTAQSPKHGAHKSAEAAFDPVAFAAEAAARSRGRGR